MLKNVKNILALAIFATVFASVGLSISPVYAAESKPASPGFGDPVDKDGQKVTGDAKKCKPGDKDCAVVQYKCYQGAKRRYYVNNSSECGVEKDEVTADGTKKSVMWYLNRVINVVLGVLGVVTVAMIIMGGIQYTTSSGDAAKAQKAQKTIIFGVVGLVIALLAFAIVNFVLTNVFK